MASEMPKSPPPSYVRTALEHHLDHQRPRSSSTKKQSIDTFQGGNINVHPDFQAILKIPGGLMVLARVRPSADDEFVQILLPVAMSYDTLVCKLCVALSVHQDDVRKVWSYPIFPQNEVHAGGSSARRTHTHHRRCYQIATV
jgi:hypothetical protein